MLWTNFKTQQFITKLNLDIFVDLKMLILSKFDKINDLNQLVSCWKVSTVLMSIKVVPILMARTRTHLRSCKARLLM